MMTYVLLLHPAFGAHTEDQTIVQIETLVIFEDEVEALGANFLMAHWRGIYFFRVFAGAIDRVAVGAFGAEFHAAAPFI